MARVGRQADGVYEPRGWPVRGFIAGSRRGFDWPASEVREALAAELAADRDCR